MENFFGVFEILIFLLIKANEIFFFIMCPSKYSKVPQFFSHEPYFFVNRAAFKISKSYDIPFWEK